MAEEKLERSDGMVGNVTAVVNHDVKRLGLMDNIGQVGSVRLIVWEDRCFPLARPAAIESRLPVVPHTCENAPKICFITAEHSIGRTLYSGI